MGTSIDQVAASDIHCRVLRYLLAAVGLEEKYLTEEERTCALDLETLGFVTRSRSGRLEINGSSTELGMLARTILGVDSNNHRVGEELERLRSEHREISSLLSFIQEVTSTIIRTHSVAELFRAAFRQLAERVDIDVAVAVMLEQNLDVYISKTEELSSAVNDGLIANVREILHSQIPVSFVSTDVVVQAEFTDLPARRDGTGHLRDAAHTILSQDNRTAGMLALFRTSGPFSVEEQRILEILSSQVSMVLGNIRAHERIQNLADTDDLTGIWNKRYFRRQLPHELERSRIYSIPVSLIMFDIDDFKGINDTYGHTMGDVVLSELCGTVRETLRPPDLFARFGGDEFAIVLPHTDLWGARAVAERMLARVRELEVYAPDGVTRIPCSLSMGVATYLPPDMTASDLLQHADERLYLSKKSGKNRYSW